MSAVRSLKALMNSMMLMPCWPSAGPTGGAAVAAPAGAWTFSIARIFFAIRSPRGPCGADAPLPLACGDAPASPSVLLELFDLEEVELHGRLATEDADEHLDLVAL